MDNADHRAGNEKQLGLLLQEDSIMGKYISGFSKQSNLDAWSAYAKRNSYGDNKAQATDILAPVEGGGLHSRENDWSKDDWQVPQKDREGRGWCRMEPVAADNTFTGKGGSKRGD
jgi:hypothetical protein